LGVTCSLGIAGTGRSDQIAAVLELDAQPDSLPAPEDPILTQREHEISRLICAGLTNGDRGAAEHRPARRRYSCRPHPRQARVHQPGPSRRPYQHP